MYKLDLPLRVLKNKSKLQSINLNIYRNIHHFSNNTMKKNYKELIAPQVAKLPVFKAISLTLTLYPKTKRLCDLDNVCSIQTKFLLDTLVTMGKLPDDTYIYVPKIVFKIGVIDKNNPRIEAIIKEYDI